MKRDFSRMAGMATKSRENQKDLLKKFSRDFNELWDLKNKGGDKNG